LNSTEARVISFLWGA